MEAKSALFRRIFAASFVQRSLQKQAGAFLYIYQAISIEMTNSKRTPLNMNVCWSWAKAHSHPQISHLPWRDLHISSCVVLQFHCTSECETTLSHKFPPQKLEDWSWGIIQLPSTQPMQILLPWCLDTAFWIICFHFPINFANMMTFARSLPSMMLNQSRQLSRSGYSVESWWPFPCLACRFTWLGLPTFQRRAARKCVKWFSSFSQTQSCWSSAPRGWKS